MHYGGNGHRSRSIWAHEPILTPERRVWRAVLYQAFEDAEMTPVNDETATDPLEASEARQYLRADRSQEAENLKLVCDFADLPADRVVLWARRKCAPEPEPMECGGSLALGPEGPPLLLPPQSSISSGM